MENEKESSILLYTWNYDPGCYCIDPAISDYSKTNLLNTRTCLILTYIAFGLSLSIYLVQGYLRSFPDDIMEAAVIDGCGIYRMMWHIVVPLMKNAIVTVLVLQFFLNGMTCCSQ